MQEFLLEEYNADIDTMKHLVKDTTIHIIQIIQKDLIGPFT